MPNCLKLLPSLRLLVPMATIGLIVASSTAFAAQEVKMVEHASTITLKSDEMIAAIFPANDY